MEKKKEKKRIGIPAAALLCTLSLVVGIAGALAAQRVLNSSDSMDKFQTVRSILENEWYYANQQEDLDETLMENAIIGMSDLEKDPHTNYFSLEQAQAFSQSLQGSNVGIGIAFSENSKGQIQINNVFISSPAQKAGLQSGDIILKIDDQDVSNLSSDEVIEIIKNKKDETIRFLYQHDGKEQEVSITPANYDSSVSYRKIGDAAYVIVNSFSENSGKYFAQALEKAKKEGCKDLILDLRNNTGGYLSAAMDISSSLLEKGSVVFQEKTKDGKTTKSKAEDTYPTVDFNEIIILQNENSASASEVLIGALKENLKDKVTTIGKTSYGKGTEQMSVPFDDGTSIKYTVAEWLTPEGNSINLKGFTPDIEVDLPASRTVGYQDLEEDEVIEADSVHANAKAVQVFLDYLGYPADRQDLYFSSQSSEALKEFQEDFGLEPTGKIDQKTLQALINAVNEKFVSNVETEDSQLAKALEIVQKQ